MFYRLDRYEKKFLITQEQRERLLAEMGPYFRKDENTGEDDDYPIVSLYYDTPERDCYWERHHGLASRRKLRVRLYGREDGRIPPTSFIEVKHSFEGRGVKRRVLLPLEEALALGRGEMPSIPLGRAGRHVAREILTFVQHRKLQPVCLLRYNRVAFMGMDSDSDLRVTFDSGVRYRMDNLTPRPDDRDFDNDVMGGGLSIMEVKFIGAVPYWLSLLLGRNGCIPVSFSKFSTAIEKGDSFLRRGTRLD